MKAVCTAFANFVPYNRRTVILRFLLLCASLHAGDAPVTLEVAASSRPPESWTPIWSPAGGAFAYVEGRRIQLYTIAAKSAKAIANLEELSAKAKSRPAAEQAWQNRRVAAVRPQWFSDGKRILAAEGGDLFVIDVDSGGVKQLTATPAVEEDPRLSPDGTQVAYRTENDIYVLSIAGGKPRRLTFDGSATLWNGRLDWVYPEELSLSRAYWWSPDGMRLAYMQFDVSPEMIHPHVDASPVMARAEPQRFPKAGTPNANVRLGVIAAKGGKTKWMDLGSTAEALLARVDWMPGGKELAVQRLSRIQDRVELLAVDAAAGQARVLVEERDKHWVNLHDIVHFFADGKFLWASERDGHRHLYLFENGKPKQLTSGDWEITQWSGIDKSHAYFVATKDSVLERNLFRLDLASGELKRLTPEKGTHAIAMSPDAAFYIDSLQGHATPARQTLHSADGTHIATLTDSSARFKNFDLLPLEYVTFKGRDGTLFHGQMIKPKNFNASKRYPAIVMVYGGPHTQTVRDNWAGANWEQALAHKGYVIWRMDNRGSNYRGHAFETPVHRELGKTELADQLEGVEYLTKLGFVDPARVGIYGWSYGGYMTLYSMTHSKAFAAGVAGAPVTDWRNYDTIYTERYMGLPARNEEGYKAASPVHSAKDLSGKLMLVHNFQDDNVLFQNSQHMMEALQKAGKQFEMMFYPLKSHGVTGPLRLHSLQTITAFFDRVLTP